MGKRLWAAIVAGLVVGTLDIGVASVLAQVSPDKVLHFLAAGVLGRQAAFAGGWQTAALGLFIQEFISVVAAFLYALASGRLPMLLDRAIFCGIAYGAVCNIVLTFVVQPLSLVARIHPLDVTGWLENLAANMILYGPPMVLILKRMLRARA